MYYYFICIIVIYYLFVRLKFVILREFIIELLFSSLLFSHYVMSNSSGHKSCPWTVVSQQLPSMELPRQEYWSGLPLPLQGVFLPFSAPWDLSQGQNSCLLYQQVDSSLLSHQGSILLIRKNNKVLKLDILQLIRNIFWKDSYMVYNVLILQ